MGIKELTTVIVCSIVIFSVIIYLAIKQETHRKSKCQQRGGIIVKTEYGSTCFSRSAVIDLD